MSNTAHIEIKAPKTAEEKLEHRRALRAARLERLRQDPAKWEARIERRKAASLKRRAKAKAFKQEIAAQLQRDVAAQQAPVAPKPATRKPAAKSQTKSSAKSPAKSKK